jgi:hypothetical protein
MQGRALSAGIEPMMPALHCSITSLGLLMMNSGEADDGQREILQGLWQLGHVVVFEKLGRDCHPGLDPGSTLAGRQRGLRERARNDSQSESFERPAP